jgi:hypothetical protein
MADEYYARGDIQHGDKLIKAGTKVSNGDLGDSWDQLVESGAVGTEKFEHANVSGVVAEALTDEEREAVQATPEAKQGSVRASSMR